MVRFKRTARAAAGKAEQKEGEKENESPQTVGAMTGSRATIVSQAEARVDQLADDPMASDDSSDSSDSSSSEEEDDLPEMSDVADDDDDDDDDDEEEEEEEEEEDGG